MEDEVKAGNYHTKHDRSDIAEIGEGTQIEQMGSAPRVDSVANGKQTPDRQSDSQVASCHRNCIADIIKVNYAE